jgi:drug/metabolite transporter (DMT)-like permease
MFLFVITNSLADSTSKILFLNHQDLGVMEMLFLRGIIVIFMMAALIGNDYKKILWQSIPRNMVAPLLIRCMSGLLAFFCLSTAIKHLPIVIVALF